MRDTIYLKKSYRKNRLLGNDGSPYDFYDSIISIEDPLPEEIIELKKYHHPESCKKCGTIHWIPDRVIDRLISHLL
jgi:hypothetical protein